MGRITKENAFICSRFKLAKIFIIIFNIAFSSKIFEMLGYVPSKEQFTDILPKPLPRETFEYLRQKLGVFDASSCC